MGAEGGPGGAVRRAAAPREGGASGQDDSEASRARAAAQAAGRRRAAAQVSVWGRAVRAYQRADELVSMPFLIGLSFVLSGMVYYGRGAPPPADLGEGGGDEWRWVQGVGKDVVGKVNCTTYLHAPSGALLELGHGSGGGVAFKLDEKANVRWVWEDGALEEQEALACPEVEKALRGGAGRRGKPRAMMLNRYGKMFWVGAAEDDGRITYRNSNNPVVLELVKEGFRFTTISQTELTFLGGKLVAPPQPEKPLHTAVVEQNETSS